MPCSPPKSRVLLKEKQAVVVNGTPFAILLTIATGESMQAFSPEEEAAYEMLSLALSKKTGEKNAAEANRSPKRPVGAKSGALRNHAIARATTIGKTAKNSRRFPASAGRCAAADEKKAGPLFDRARKNRIKSLP